MSDRLTRTSKGGRPSVQGGFPIKANKLHAHERVSWQLFFRLYPHMCVHIRVYASPPFLTSMTVRLSIWTFLPLRAEPLMRCGIANDADRRTLGRRERNERAKNLLNSRLIAGVVRTRVSAHSQIDVVKRIRHFYSCDTEFYALFDSAIVLEYMTHFSR